MLTKPLMAALAMALAAAPVVSHADAGAHPFSVEDLVRLKRVSDPHLSPDGQQAVFSMRHTDYAKDKGVTDIYTLDLAKAGATPHELVAHAASPRYASDGKTIYFLSSKSGRSQLWSVPAAGGKATQLTDLPVGINNFVLAPGDHRVALSIDVFTDCDTLDCTRQRLDARAKNPTTGHLYKKLFVRHWDTWSDDRRSQLFVANLDAPKQAPVWVSKGIDGDIPSKPFGGDTEYSFSPDGKTVYFDARIAGTSEPWSTNFDIYRVPADGSSKPENLTADNKAWDGWPVASPDGSTLYYLAQKEPGFESDRFGIWALDLTSGKRHEVDPKWDRSAGDLAISTDGSTLFVTADDEGQHPLFAIDAKSGDVTKKVADGAVGGFDVGANRILLSRTDLKHPADLYTLGRNGNLTQVTHVNRQALAKTAMGDAQFFTFKGWHGENVQGYVVKPANFQPGQTYPVAFIVHGGPQGAMTNSWSYRWNPQTYAGQGFAVVTINFHGSTGYGQAFTNAISGDWGGKPLDDLKAGWKYAQDKYAFLDGNRACALGASYGGYMVYWMAGVWNKPWKCFVDHDGVFDARMMYYATDELWFEEKENGGPQYLHPDNYERFNPIDHVKDWHVPMLIVHSGHDFRIPLTQGLGAFTALQRRGIPSEFLTFPDENHWVLKPHNSVMWHHTVNAWLERWTKKGAGDSAGK
ncbi:S9 family peptidase [Oleiagrimonas sp. C23AA]|uniref:S9 family peptidase n=1 Tax=Oleiagrimonas sp. C23AA TaxID=2719047 RepID=UPI00142301F4|nr:S9 family peptidase [Oleiagrimonas sp. C23AA]NII11449.1 S9 family peptidase [Oleiagrimonas sp. C23AA]